MARRSSSRQRKGGSGDDNKQKLLIGAIVIAALALIIYLFIPSTPKHYYKDVYERVASVEQGNIVVLGNGLRVQLLGVDNSDQARDFLQREVVGKMVRLVPDSKDATPYYQNIVPDMVARAYVSVDANCTYRALNGYLLHNHLAGFNMNFCQDSAAVYQSYANDSAANDESNKVASCDANTTLLSKVELNKKMGCASMLIVVNGESIGTGFFINEDGLALTNVHVIRNISDLQGDNVLVFIADKDGQISSQRYRPFGRIVRIDEENDCAAFTVKLDANEKVPYLNLARKRPEAGTDIAAFGHTLGQVGTFTTGEVSAIRENMNKLQISVPIDQGNSGGPVCDFYGRVVGIAQAIYIDPTTGEKNRSNVNFAVDIQVVRKMLDQATDIKTYGGK